MRHVRVHWAFSPRVTGWNGHLRQGMHIAEDPEKRSSPWWAVIGQAAAFPPRCIIKCIGRKRRSETTSMENLSHQNYPN